MRSDRLTAAEVAEIRSRLAHGDTGQSLAETYGVSTSTISNVRYGRTSGAPEGTPRFDNGRQAELIAERIRRNVIVDGNDCWLWQGSIDPRWGYGKTNVGSKRDGTRRPAKAHRASYEAFIGPIPDGLTIDHTCNVRRCVNPDHLVPMTIGENTLKADSRAPSAINSRKTHCVNGHPLEGSNARKSEHRRVCRTCEREAMERFRQVPCSVEGCAKPRFGRGLCAMHWARTRRR